MYFFRNMLNNKMDLKSYNYHNFEVVMTKTDISGQTTLIWYENVCVSIDVRGPSIGNINEVCCLCS